MFNSSATAAATRTASCGVGACVSKSSERSGSAVVVHTAAMASIRGQEKRGFTAKDQDTTWLGLSEVIKTGG